MASSPVVHFNELSPDERAVIEKIVGRPVGDRDIVDVRVRPAVEADRQASAQAVLDAMNSLAAGILPDVDPEELEAAIDEACDDVRHGRR